MNKDLTMPCATVMAMVCGMLLLLPCSQVHADRIYKSIDAQGHVTYSSTPSADAVQTESIVITSEYDPTTSKAHEAMIDEIQALADQLEQDRIQREQARAMARRNIEEEAAKQAPTSMQPVIEYYPVYPLGFMRQPRLRPPRHPPRRSRPPPVQQTIPDTDQ